MTIRMKMPRQTWFARSFVRLTMIAVVYLAGWQIRADDLFSFPSHQTNSLVVNVEDSDATRNFVPDPAVVQSMVNCGITNLTGQPTVAAAWRSLVSTQDIVGIKVFSAAGKISGTRPAVVAAVVHGLLQAGMPRRHVIIWDKYEDDLRAAGFDKLARQLGVRIAGSRNIGYDPTNFYLPDSPIIGNLVWGDLEFGKKGPEVGRRSFVSKLVSRRLTKIISIAPLLNQNHAGVCGHLYSLAMGSVDNVRRFEGDSGRLAVAVPEIYALPALGDRVVLNITDALIGQYEGGPNVLLQYSSVLNQIWFSRDPVALDVLAVRELARERRLHHAPEINSNLELYTNASLLQLGVSNPAEINVKKIRLNP